MLTIKIWDCLTKDEQKACLKRPVQKYKEREQAVQEILIQVREQGDAALYELTTRFDQVNLSSIRTSITTKDSSALPLKTLKAIEQAIRNIRAYHKTQLPQTQRMSPISGVTITTVYKPLKRVGIYVPQGLISSLLMQVVPAQVAGCAEIIICTHPNAEGEIAASIRGAAALCGIDKIYTLGGAHAIAAMAYGTETVPKVDKIFGPGNSYVTQAKNIVAQDPEGAAIDLPAGPSEAMIVAGKEANPDFIAADLLAQAEHGGDSQVILICDNEGLALRVNEALRQQAKKLPRTPIVQQAFAQSCILISTNLSQTLKIINEYAPEHLLLQGSDVEPLSDQVQAAGTIFRGAWAAEALGDYATGSNHVLPTYGFARNHRGLSTRDFFTGFTVQDVNRQGLKSLAETVMTLAKMEQLTAHAYAVQVRLNALEVGQCL